MMKGGKKRMNKFAILSVLLGVFVFGGLGVVMGQSDDQQEVNVTIGEDIHFAITPETLDFGSVSPGVGKTPINGPIIIDVAGSNVDVLVEVTNVTGFPFETGLKFDGELALESEWTFDCNVENSICVYEEKTINPTLDIPLGVPTGQLSGVITYTIMEKPL